MINNYKKYASIYSKHSNTGTAFLAYKFLPEILQNYSNGNIALDFGCGSGSSTRFLKDMGYKVIGIDINQAMLREATSHKDGIRYEEIKNNIIPFADNTFDMAFSSFVLFEISSKQKMVHIFNEVSRVLKANCTFIAITGSTDMYQYPWLSLDTDFSENKALTSGKIAKVYLKEIDLIVYDYYWTNDDYIDVIKKSDFTLLEKKFPLGEDSDPYEWVSEKYKSPYVIYILKNRKRT